jgi:hypothetical protein
MRVDQGETPIEYRERVQGFLAVAQPQLTPEQRVRLAQSYLTEARSLFPGMAARALENASS